MSPSKREVVYTAVGKGARRCLIDTPRKKRTDALSPQTLEAINAFYQRDDISRMCPGKKECISVKDDDGVRTNKQKRLLLMTISEAHQLFLSDFPGISISLSMFAKQRPEFVRPTSDKDHDRQCEMCSTDELLQCVAGADPTTPVTYYQWQTQDGKTVKIGITTQLNSAVSELQSQLHKFARHVYNERRQHMELRHLKETIKPGEVIVQEDFSENFAIRHQAEIMSAH